MTGRELLDVMAEYVEARENARIAGGDGEPIGDPDEIADRFEALLSAYVDERSSGTR